METATFYELLGGIAFLMLVGAHTLAVIVLRGIRPETASGRDHPPVATPQTARRPAI